MKEGTSLDLHIALDAWPQKTAEKLSVERTFSLVV